MTIYGWHGFYALTCLLEEEKRKEMSKTYIAEHLWLLTGAIYAISGNTLNTPRYTEMMNPELKKSDNRSADEIISSIKGKLSKE